MSMQDAAPTAISDEIAVSRLFELSRSGEIGNSEYAQLDSMIHQRLLQAYGSEVVSFSTRAAA